MLTEQFYKKITKQLVAQTAITLPHSEMWMCACAVKVLK